MKTFRTVAPAGMVIAVAACSSSSVTAAPAPAASSGTNPGPGSSLNPTTGETRKLPPMPRGDSSPWLMELADGRLLWISYPGAWIFGA